MERGTLRAAVVGLGKAGSRFDEEPRGAVWSHVGAYLALSDLYELAGTADPDQHSATAFSRRCPGVRCFSSAAEMCSAIRPDVVSIATPIKVRAQIFDEVLKAPEVPRVIICEKPLATDSDTRQELVTKCAAKGVSLLVHYNRRYASAYQRMRASMAGGDIGKVASITISIANRLWSIGSHALDLLLYLSGEPPCRWRTLELPALRQDDEPAVDFICRFPSGIAGRILNHGRADVLIFEVSVTGDKGRLLATGNGERVELVRFTASPKYAGYMIGLPPECLYTTPADESTFTAVVKEAAEVVMLGKQPSCTGQMALESESFLDILSNQREHE